MNEVAAHLKGLAGRIAEYGKASARINEIAGALAGVGTILESSHQALAVQAEKSLKLQVQAEALQQTEAVILGKLPALLEQLQVSGVPKALEGVDVQLKALVQGVEDQGKKITKELPVMLAQLQASGIPTALEGVNSQLKTLTLAVEQQGKLIGKVGGEASQFAHLTDRMGATISVRVQDAEKRLTEDQKVVARTTETSKDLLIDIIKGLGAISRDLEEVKRQGWDNAARIERLAKRRGFIW